MVFDGAKFTIVALLIITPFRFFIAQPFIVQGASMTPTIDPKEYLVIDQIWYRFHEPKRGDVVIFRYPLDPEVFFVKRIIGLPGETVEVRAGAISVTTASGENTVLDEPYAAGVKVIQTPKVTLEEGEYYVMGDNRDASSDSRVWGPLQSRYIIGRAAARLYPLGEFSLFPGKYEFFDENN